MTAPNLRKDARVDVRIPVVVVRGKTSLVREGLNVSFRGLFLATDDPPPLRSLVRLRVTLPSRTIEAHAMAVHHGPEGEGRARGVGLQFWGLSGEDRKAWEQFVSQRLAERRAAEKQAASGVHPATTEMATPSGIRVTALRGRASSS